MAAEAEALKYNAMAAMCGNIETENKRLLQSVADKDVIIAAGLKREQDHRSRYANMYDEHMEWVNKYGNLSGEHVVLQQEHIKALKERRDAINENKEMHAEMMAVFAMLMKDGASRSRRKHEPTRTRSETKAETDRIKRRRAAGF